AMSPKITVFLPALKKDALETALYQLTVLGINHIQLYTSSKAYRESISPTFKERWQRIMIAAAEQSKQLVLPILSSPITFEKILEIPHENPLYFADPEGVSCSELISSLKNKPSALSLM